MTANGSGPLSHQRTMEAWRELRRVFYSTEVLDDGILVWLCLRCGATSRSIVSMPHEKDCDVAMMDRVMLTAQKQPDEADGFVRRRIAGLDRDTRVWRTYQDGVYEGPVWTEKGIRHRIHWTDSMKAHDVGGNFRVIVRRADDV